MEYNSKPDPNESQRRDHMLRKFGDVGWHIKGQFYYTPPKGIGLSYPVQYQALIDPWGESKVEQIVNLSVDMPNQLADEMLRPVRDAARKVVETEISKIENES